MTIKLLCDICESEDDAQPYLRAQGAILCSKHRVEYEDLVCEDFAIITKQAEEIRLRAFNAMEVNMRAVVNNVTSLPTTK